VRVKELIVDIGEMVKNFQNLRFFLVSLKRIAIFRIKNLRSLKINKKENF
jgi:hypothetical protein